MKRITDQSTEENSGEREKTVQGLIDDEVEAIDGYEKALETETRPAVIKAYKDIIIDEKRHKAMLEEIKSGELEAMALFGLEDRYHG
jgi:rubrerythrin